MSWTAWVPALTAPALLSVALTGTPVFEFADAGINESSGLVDLGATMVTTNDSGGEPEVFVVDPGNGKTIGRTTFADEVTDVEALAPAGTSTVWVGDIGDNTEGRSSVQVYKVPVGRGNRTVSAPVYDLVYPDGPHDAESLLAGPDGRLRIISKGVMGGRVYTAPKDLRTDRPNKLVAGPPVGIWATDAALFPDGHTVLVRGYGAGIIATFPQLDPLAEVELPGQEQGEGVSIGTNGRIRLSSEGEHSAVLQVTLPADLKDALAGKAPTAAEVDRPRSVTEEQDDDDLLPWLLLGAGLIGGALLSRVVLRRRP